MHLSLATKQGWRLYPDFKWSPKIKNSRRSDFRLS